MESRKVRILLLLTILVVVLSFASTGAVVYAQDSLLAKAHQNGSVAVIVGLRAEFRPGGELNQAQANAQTASIDVLRRSIVSQLGADARVKADSLNWSIPFVAMQVSEAGLQKLRSSPQVASVQEDYLMKRDLTQSTRVIHADEAWNYGKDGAGWSVAVLDTGVDASHTMLAGKVVAEACFSTNYTDTFFLDGSDDSSQEICNTVVSSAPGQISAVGAGASSPQDCINKVLDSFTEAGCSHGTHVSGIVAGNDANYRGVAPGSSIIGVEVFSYFPWYDDAYSWTSDQISGLNWVYQQRLAYNIAAVNMSLGGAIYNNQATCDAANAGTKAAIDNLRSVGIATVIASGNSGYTAGIGAPGCISSAIAVGASDKFDVPASFSNSHAMLDLYAPGVSICSSVVGGYSCWNGTSMATPHVAGAWAVLKQAYYDYYGGHSASVEAILRSMQDTGRPLTRVGVTRPRIDVGRAMRLLTGFVSLTASTAAPTPNQIVAKQATLSWTRITWATRYEIQVDNNSAFTSPEFATTVGTSEYPQVTTGPLSDGVYSWRVRAVKVDQSVFPAKITNGPWSAVGTFVVNYYLKQYP